MKQKIDDITIGNDRRRLDEQKVRELAESIKSIGLLNPITVTNENKLVAGEHRLRACLWLGWTEIECQTIQGNELLQQLAEIDENLVRNDLHWLDIGELAIQRDEILEALGLRAQSGTNQKNTRTGETISPVQKTTGSIAKEMGTGERTLQHNKQLARTLEPEIKEVVRTAEVPKKDALKIARMEPERQKAVVEKIACPSFRPVFMPGRRFCI